MNMFGDLSDVNKEASDVFFENTIKNLTAKDSEVLLKDMKEILTNLKVATRYIVKITTDIDKMVPYIVPRSGDKE